MLFVRMSYQRKTSLCEEDRMAQRRRLRLAWFYAALCLALNVSTNSVCAEDVTNTNVPLGVVRVVQSRLAVPVPKTPRVFEVGNRTVLFQENDQFYIVMVDEPNGQKTLAAAPRRKGNQKVGWVTPENVLFFGFRTESVDGVFYLTAGEEWPVVREEAGRYYVEVRRGKHAVILELPKADPGLYFIPNPVAEKSVAGLPSETKPTSPATRALERDAPLKISRVKDRTEAARDRTAVLPVSETERILSLLDTNWESTVLSFLLPDEWAEARELSIASEPAWWRHWDLGWDTKEREPLADLAKRSLQWIIAGAFALVVLCTGGIWSLRRFRLAKQEKLASAQAPPPAPPAEEAPVMLSAPPAPDFSGSLASMSLAAVLQFLNSDKETGKLTLHSEDHSPIATVFFADGEIIDAQIGDKMGVQAVYEIMGLKEGHFAFVRSKTQSVPRVIEQPTMTLLLEANRLLDEKKEQEPQEPASKSSRRKDSLRLRRRASH